MAVFDLSTFLFTDSDDSVTQESEIIIPSGSSVNTLDGDDLVRSEYTTTSSSQGSVAGSVFGINVQGSFEMNGGNDRVESYVTYSGTRLPQAGLVNALSVGSGNNTTTFSTGDGDDRIIASAISSTFSRNAIGIANLSDSTIDTGNENDLVFGSAQNVLGTLSYGIQNQGSGSEPASDISPLQMGYSLITTGSGNDKVVGTGNVSAGTAIGINNENGVIDTGSDSDVVLGIANVITSGSAWGIYGGDINTGDGSDKVIAFAAVNGEQVDGFGGGVNVDLGAGRDFLAGFGEGTFSGGSGLDILSLRGYSIDEFTINIIDRDTSAVNFSIGDVTMVTEQFELFIFNDFIARGIGELPQPV